MADSDRGPVEVYAEQLSAIADPIAVVDASAEELIRRFEMALAQLPTVERDTVVGLFRDEPDFVPLVGAVIGLSQERLIRQLQMGTGSGAWVKRSREEPHTLVDFLDEQFGIIAALDQARQRTYTLADVLMARASRGAGAGDAIDAGRKLEDLVEEVIRNLGLQYDTRTRYIGRAGQDGPADFAVPQGGRACQIAVGVKGFDSTGSKLTAAVDEVRRMADVRLPTQFIYVIVDGVGWHGRKGDLGRLVDMTQNGEIDGMFSQAALHVFSDQLRNAAVRTRLLDP